MDIYWPQHFNYVQESLLFGHFPLHLTHFCGSLGSVLYPAGQSAAQSPGFLLSSDTISLRQFFGPLMALGGHWTVL